MVIGDATPDGQPGLWWVCEVNNPAAQPILRDAKSILVTRLASASPSIAS